MNQFIRNLQRALALGALSMGSAFAGANPGLPFYGYGAIVATPHYPIVGENTHIAVTVGNTGDTDAHNVQLKISFNDWGVTYQGWQEIATVTIATIPAGGTAVAETDHVFVTRTHTCLEALIVGADDNTDPNDDRGQINLEVINSGESFSYDVPVVNNGDHPVNLVVVGKCQARGADGSLPPGPCKDDVKQVQLAPGEEALVPVQIDLHGFAVGQELDFILDAFDMNAGPGAFLPNNHNHIQLKIVRETARHLKKKVLAQLNGLAGGPVDKNVKNQLNELIKKLQKTLDDGNWADDNRLNKNGGAEVFAHDADIARKLLEHMRGNLPITIKSAMDDAIRALVDSDRILANTANADGGNANRADLRDGDADREAGDYPGAVNDYKRTWQAATH